MTILADPRQVGALGLTFLISNIIFGRRVLVLNRFHWPLTSIQWFAYWL